MYSNAVDHYDMQVQMSEQTLHWLALTRMTGKGETGVMFSRVEVKHAIQALWTETLK